MKKALRALGLGLILPIILALLPTVFVATPDSLAIACTVTLSPRDNIQTAIDNASPGDIVCLSAGTYSPRATVHISKSVSILGPQGVLPGD